MASVVVKRQLQQPRSSMEEVEEVESHRLIVTEDESTAAKDATVRVTAESDVSGSHDCGCFGASGCPRLRLPDSLRHQRPTKTAAADAPSPAPRSRHHRPASLDDLCRRTRFTRRELRRLYRGFKNDCPSGAIRRDDFREILGQFFPQGDATAYADLVFNSLTVQSGGGCADPAVVTFDVAVVALSAMCRGDELERLGWAFRLADTDGDGRLTRPEVARLVTAVYDLLGASVRPRVGAGDVLGHADTVFNRMLTAAAVGEDCVGGGDDVTAAVVTFAQFASVCRQGRDLDREFACLETLI